MIALVGHERRIRFETPLVFVETVLKLKPLGLFSVAEFIDLVECLIVPFVYDCFFLWIVKTFVR